MGTRGKVKRKDGPHKEIVKDLKKIGAGVLDLSGVGGGCPDLLVWYRARQFLIEVKSPGKKLRDSQLTFIHRWPGTVFIVESSDEALQIVKWV